MISLSQVTEVIQNGLNAISDDREFVIFNDVGEFKDYYRQEGSNSITRYVNGIMEAMEPTIIPIKNLQVVTQSFRVTFVLDMDLLEKDTKGDYIEVANIRNLLTKYISSVNAIPYTLTNDDVSFEVTPTFSGATVGTASQMSPIGNVLPMYLDFSCVFVESGVNTNNVEFIINGESMFFSDYSASRVRTAETSMVANEPSQKTFIQANGLSLNLSMPLLQTTQSKDIEADVWGGSQNQAICVERYRANAKTPYSCYIMTYGNNAETGGVGQNIGQVLDLVEGKQDVLNYGAGWETTTFTGTRRTLSMEANKVKVVFWGDGTSQHISKNVTLIMHTYKVSGTYTIRVFSY